LPVKIEKFTASATVKLGGIAEKDVLGNDISF
jgi:hypothetical protein